MRLQYCSTVALLLLFCTYALAAVPNDICSTATPVTLNLRTTFDLKDAVGQDGPCDAGSGFSRSAWFKFTLDYDAYDVEFAIDYQALNGQTQRITYFIPGHDCSTGTPPCGTVYMGTALDLPKGTDYLILFEFSPGTPSVSDQEYVIDLTIIAYLNEIIITCPTTLLEGAPATTCSVEIYGFDADVVPVLVSAPTTGYTGVLADINFNADPLVMVDGSTATFSVGAAADNLVEGSQNVGFSAGVIDATPAFATSPQITLAAITITDADQLTITVNSVTGLTEGGTFAPTVTVNPPIEFAVTVNVAYDVANIGNDFMPSIATVAFNVPAATATGVTQPIIVAADDAVEPDSITFVGSVSSVTGLGSIGYTKVDSSNTILDSDTTTITLTGGPASSDENLYSSTPFTVTSSAPLEVSIPITLTYLASTSPSASISTDFSSGTSVVILDSSNQNSPVSFPVSADTVAEQNENFGVSFATTVSGVTPSRIVLPSTSTFMIVNDDTVSFTFTASNSASEGGDVSFTVTSSTIIEGSFTFTLSATPTGTTTASDYGSFSPATQTVFSFTELTPFTLPITLDNLVEPAEEFSVSLSITSTLPNTVPGPSSTWNQPAPILISIVDPDTLSLTFTPPALFTEPASAQQTLSVQVSANKHVQGGLTIQAVTDDSNSGTTATANSDYVSSGLPTIILFTETGVLDDTYDITINPDALAEPTEGIVVNFSYLLLGATIPTTATVTALITDSDTASISAQPSAQTVLETAGVVTVTFRVDGASIQGPVTFTIEAQPNTAVLNTDYTFTTTTRTLTNPAAGDTFTVTTTILENLSATSARDFSIFVSSSSLSYVALTNARNTITISTDRTVTLSLNSGLPSTITEGPSVTIPVTVSLSAHVSGGFSIPLVITSTDTEGTDDISLSPATLSFTPGGPLSQLVTITIVNDQVVESPESFVFGFGTPTGVGSGITVVSTATYSATINDDDTTTVTITSAPGSESTGAPVPLTFTVTSTNAVEGGWNFIYTLQDVPTTTSADYTHTVAPLAFPFQNTPGPFTGTISISITDDNLLEPSETLRLVVGTPTATDPGVLSRINLPIAPTFDGVILDNEAPVSISIADATTAIETSPVSSTLNFVITATGTVQGGIDILLSISPTTPSADFTAPSTSFTMTSTTYTFSVTITDDNLVEPDETLVVTINTVTSSPSVTVTDGVAQGIIQSNDQASVTVSSPSADEEIGSLLFVITSTAPVQGGFIVNLAVTPNLPNTVAADYTVASSTILTFAGLAGEVSTLTLTFVDDSIVEVNKIIIVTPSVSGTLIPAASFTLTAGTGTILNTDTTSIIPNSFSTVEGQPGTITFSSSNPVQGGFTINYLTVAGTALPSSDYTAVTGSTLSFGSAPGASATATVATVDDLIVENTEQFRIALQSASIVSIVSASAISVAGPGIVTITDNDKTTISIDDVSQREESNPFVFTVSHTGEVDNGFTVNFAVELLGTTSNADLVTFSTSTTFAGTAIGSSRTISIFVTNDALVEVDQQFKVVVESITATPIPATSFITTDFGIGTIENQDTTTITFSRTSGSTVTEGAKAQYRFSLSNPVEEDFDIHMSYIPSTSGASYFPAVLDVDYTPVYTASVKAAVTSVNFAIDTINDSLVELTEGFNPIYDPNDRITSIIPDNFFIYPKDDPPPEPVGIADNDFATLTISSQTVLETAGSVTVSISSMSNIVPPIDIDIYTPPGTPAATYDDDFSLAIGIPTVTYPGSGSASFGLNIKGDALVEADEIFAVEGAINPLDPWVNFKNRITIINGTCTIQDTTTTTITASPVTATGAEDSGPLDFVFSTSNAVDGDFSFQLQAVSGGTAMDPSDYTLPTSTVTFINQTLPSTFTVFITSDSIVEPQETFSLASKAGSLITTYASQAARITWSPLTINGIITDTTDQSSLILAPQIANTFSYAEGTNPVFTVTLSEAVQDGFQIQVTLTPNAQTESTDYTFPVTILDFDGTANEVKTFTLSITDDQIVELDTEGFTLTLGVPSAEAADIDENTFGSITITINDNDETTVSANAVIAAEGTSASVTFTSSRAVEGGFSIGWIISDGSATSPADYSTPAAGTISFSGSANEVGTGAVVIPLVADDLVEGSETLTVTPSGVSGTTLTRGFAIAAGTVTITNIDVPVFSITSGSTEEGGDLTLTLATTDAISGGFAVLLSYTDPLAVTSSDFAVPRPTVLIFTQAETSKTFSISTAEDLTVEIDETFTVSLSAIVAGNINVGPLSSSATGSVTITNDDTTTITVSDGGATEGSGVAITITSSAPVDQGFVLTASTFTLAQANGAETSDYSITPLTVSFTGTAGEQRTVTINTLPDAIVELDEVFGVGVSVASSAVSADDFDTTDTGTGTITNDDSTSLSISGTTTISEGTQNVLYTVTSTSAVEGGFNVPVSIANIGSTTAADYTFSPASLSFSGNAGESQTFFVAEILSDNLVEPPSEQFTLSTGTITNTAIPAAQFGAAGTLTVTISDTETATITVSSITVAEPSTSGVITFTLSKATQDSFSIPIINTPGTATSIDYSFPSSSVIFSGSTTSTILLSVNNDNIVENTESFTLNVDDPATINVVYLRTRITSTGPATEFITSEDSTVLTITDDTKSEGTALTFSLSLTNPVDDAFVVNIGVSFPGDAVAADLGTATLTVNFAALATTGTFTQPTIDDNIVEPAETFLVSVTSVSNYDITTPANSITTTDTATGTITNNDNTVITLEISTLTALSEPENFTPTQQPIVNVFLSAPVSVPISVPLSFTGTATATLDYNAVSSVNFGANVQTTSFTLSIIDEAIVETDETVVIGASAPTVTGIAASQFIVTATATYTIQNDDSVSITIAAPPSAVSESVGVVSFVISLNQAVAFAFGIGITAADGSAVVSSDYNPQSTSVSFPAFVQSANFAVSIINDDIAEPTETFSISFTENSLTGVPISPSFFFYNPTTGSGSSGPPVNYIAPCQSSSTYTLTAPAGQFGCDGYTDNIASGWFITVPTGSLITFTFVFLDIEGYYDNVLIYDGTNNNAPLLGVYSGSVLPSAAIQTSSNQAYVSFNSDPFISGPLYGLLGFTIEYASFYPTTASINDNDVITITVNDQTVSESATSIAFTFVATAAASQAYTVTLAATDISTQGAADYTVPGSFQVTFAAGSTTQTVSIGIVQNTVVEPTEQFTISMTGIIGTTIPAGSFVISDTAVGTITNDDSAAVTVADVTSSAESGTMLFQFILTADVAGGFNVPVSVTGTTAESTDYALQTTTLTFTGTANEVRTATVNVNTDTIVELNEEFIISMGAASVGSVTTSDTAIGTITDDDTARVSVTTSPANEPSSVTFVFTSDSSVEGGFNLALTATGQTATLGTDFNFSPQNIALTTANAAVTVTVNVVNDDIVEGPETFLIEIVGPTGTTILPSKFIFPASVTGTITDSDAITITVGDATVTEGSGALQFTISASATVSSAYTLSFGITNIGSTTSADYTAPNPLTFNAGVSILTLSIPVTNDIFVENTETFTLSVTSVNPSDVNIASTRFTITDTGTGTINSEDTTTITISSPTTNPFSEAVGSVSFSVVNSNPVQGGVIVNFATIFPGGSNSAAAADVTLSTPSLAFTSTGVNEAIAVVVGIVGDSIVEGSEVFQVTATLASGQANVNTGAVTISGSPASATITNDDSTNLSPSSVTQLEEAGNMLFPFQLQGDVQGGFTATFSISPTIPTTTSDYTLSTPVLTFTGAAGETQTVVVIIENDNIVEPSEVFTVSAVITTSGQVAPANISPGTATGTIQNADTTSVSINNMIQNEETSPMVFTATLTNPVQGGVSVAITTSPTLPTTAGDFSLATSSVSWAGISTGTQVISVSLTNDAIVEPNESFTITPSTFTATAGFDISSFTSGTGGTGTILDTDSTTITVSDQTGYEGTQLVFPFTLTNPVEAVFTVNIQANAGTATTADYTLVANSLSFTGLLANVPTAAVTLIDDNIAESTETFTIVMVGPVSSTPAIDPSRFIISDTAVGTILDDDPVIISTSNNGPIGEGSIATVTMLFTDPNPGGLDVYTGTVSWGDGSSATNTGVTITPIVAGQVTSGTFTATGFVYADNGVYTVTMTVSDGNGGTITGTTTITITNVAPTLSTTSTGDANSRREGNLFTLTAAWNDLGTADFHTFRVNFGDGTGFTTGTVTETHTPPILGSTSGYTGSASATHYYADNGVYTIQYCIVDDENAQTCASTSVTITNINPTIGTITSSASARTVTVLPFTIGDLGSLDTHTGTINWGDGSAPTALSITQNTFGPPGNAVGQTANVGTTTHTYTGFGFFTATVTITDDDGGSVTSSVSFLNNPSAMLLYVPFIVTWVPSTGATATDQVEIYLERGGRSAPDPPLLLPELAGTTLPTSGPSVFRPFGFTAGAAQLRVRRATGGALLVDQTVQIRYA